MFTADTGMSRSAAAPSTRDTANARPDQRGLVLGHTRTG